MNPIQMLGKPTGLLWGIAAGVLLWFVSIPQFFVALVSILMWVANARKERVSSDASFALAVITITTLFQLLVSLATGISIPAILLGNVAVLAFVLNHDNLGRKTINRDEKAQKTQNPQGNADQPRHQHWQIDSINPGTTYIWNDESNSWVEYR